MRMNGSMKLSDATVKSLTESFKEFLAVTVSGLKLIADNWRNILRFILIYKGAVAGAKLGSRGGIYGTIGAGLAGGLGGEALFQAIEGYIDKAIKAPKNPNYDPNFVGPLPPGDPKGRDFVPPKTSPTDGGMSANVANALRSQLEVQKQITAETEQQALAVQRKYEVDLQFYENSLAEAALAQQERQSFLESFDEELQLHQERNAALAQGREAIKEFAISQRVITAAKNAGIKLDEQEIAKLKEKVRLIGEYQEANAQLANKMARTEEIVVDSANAIGGAFANAFESIILGGQSLEAAIKNMARNIIGELFHIIVTQQIARAIATSFAASFGFSLPGAASGGTFGAGDVALVGEKGPEIVTFNRPATVHSNEESRRMLGGSMVVNQNFYINVQDNEQLREEMGEIAVNTSQQAVQALTKGVGVDGEIRRRFRG